MFNKSLPQEDRENMLSNFIDILNDERKPEYETMYQTQDDELIEMLQTVCAVKRLREDEELALLDIEDIKRTEMKNVKRRNSFLRKILATAAMAVILIGGGFLYQNVSNAKSAKNIAYAMIQKYDDIHSFKGVLEEKIIDKNSVSSQKIDIQYVEPNKFYALHHLEDGKTISKLYNGGDTLYEYDRNDKLTMTSINESSLQFQLATYRADRKVKEKMEQLKNAKLIGEEMLAGRETEVYKLIYKENENWVHKVWIDKGAGIALKEYFEDQNGLKITSEFIEFKSNVDVKFPTITKDDENNAIDERLTYEQKAREEQLEDIKSSFKEGQKAKVEFVGLADSNSGEFKIGEEFLVFGITESLKEKFGTMDCGTKLNVIIGFEGWTTNPIIKEVN
ncbi:hypothetical protein GOM49_01570 [Clostridium bovifaecis]|uniref:MucB/RseB N-terminal domain-containing protein n=1 Tax=Clostridium bovifaecis TaxID=2184719 RepID=A0A6I6F8D6_9CLOT|nr:hypothetical protein GOM49_01570 [Clostridium bovifaecis]